MRRRLLGLFVGVAFVLLLPATGFARTIHVFPGDSIQHAVHKARSGDVIRVAEGTYRGSVEITKNGLTLKGSGIDQKKGTAIKPGHDKRCGNGAAGICIMPHKKGHRKARTKDTVIQGFRIKGFKDFGAVASGARRTTFAHDRFTDNDEYGAAAFGSIRTKFLHNLAADGGEAGFYVGDSPKSRAILRGNRARDNGEFGFFLRDSSHGRVLRNEAVHNCLGIGLINTGAPGGVLNWQIRDNEANTNNHVCKPEEGGPPISGTGIGVLGAQKSVIKHNSVLRNRPRKSTPFAGGIVVASTKMLGGGPASDNRIVENDALRNKPADLVWDRNGKRNRFRDNRCDASIPGGLCH